MGLFYRVTWLFALLGCFGDLALCQPGGPVSPPLTSEALAVIKADVELALQSISPEGKRHPPKTSVLPGERFLLWGELFNDGHLWAIVETHSPYGVAYLEWKKDHWQFREAWDVSDCWLPVGVAAKDRGYAHITPPKQPFKLKDINGDGVPEILIAFNNDGYKLGYAIAMSQSKPAGIKMLDEYSASGEPESSAGYLITYDASGRKAWWGEKEYYKWDKCHPISRAVWRDAGGKTGEMRYEITVSGTDISKEFFYVVLEDKDGGWIITRDDLPFAVLHFMWKPKEAEEVPNIDETYLYELYLFEKLTGLPWKAFGEDVYGLKVKLEKEWQDQFEVEVTGTEAGVKLLSKPTSKRK